MGNYMEKKIELDLIRILIRFRSLEDILFLEKLWKLYRFFFFLKPLIFEGNLALTHKIKGNVESVKKISKQGINVEARHIFKAKFF